MNLDSSLQQNYEFTDLTQKTKGIEINKISIISSSLMGFGRTLAIWLPSDLFPQPFLEPPAQ